MNLKKKGQKIKVCGKLYQVTKTQEKTKEAEEDIFKIPQYHYDIKLLKKGTSQQINTPLQMREVHCNILTDFENIMGQLIDYRNCVKNQINVDMYQKIFDFGAKQEEHIDVVAEILKKPFVIYVVQERLLSLKDAFKIMINMDIMEQKKFFNKLMLQLVIQINQIDDDVAKFIGMDIDNIFIKVNKEQLKTDLFDFQFVFSFQYKSLCPRDMYNDEQVQDFIYANTCSSYVIQQILKELQTNLKLEITKQQKEWKIQEQREILTLENTKEKENNEVLKQIGFGANATVSDIRINGEIKAVKQFKVDNFEIIGEQYQEAQFGLLFSQSYLNYKIVKKVNEYMPLIEFEDVYLEYHETSETPYCLNIIMPKGQQDVLDIIYNYKEQRKQLPFELFFPIFRDCILGVVYMHNHCLAHCDIKPCNVLQINENSYKLTDYGEGENLNFQCKYLKKINFQQGRWYLKGTAGYLAPTLSGYYTKYQFNNEKLQTPLQGDIYKFDIYSLGVTLLEVAICDRFRDLNKSEGQIIGAYQKLWHTTLPLCIKQLIFQMLTWRQNDRIPTGSLYYALKDIQRRLYEGLNLWCFHPEIQQEREKYEKIYGSYEHEYNIIDKLQQSSQNGQSFYTGYQQIILRNSEDDELFVNDVVLMKPQLLLKKIIERTEDGDFKVIHLGQPRTVKRKNIFKVQLVEYNEGEIVNYFCGFKKHNNKNWIPYQVKRVDLYREQYVLTTDEQNIKQNYCKKEIRAAFDTLRLKPHQKDFFFQDFFLYHDNLKQHIKQKNDEDLEFDYSEDPLQLEIMPRAIFNINFRRIKNKDLLNKSQEIKLNLVQKNYSDFNFQNGGSNLESYQNFVKQIPFSMYVKNIYLQNCNLDSWENIGDKFPQLHTIKILKSYYFEQDTFLNFLILLKSLKYLNSLELFDILLRESKHIVNVEYQVLDILKQCPITVITLLDWQGNKSNQDIEFFTQIWETLNKRILQKLKIDIVLIENDTSEDNITKLKSVIEDFFIKQVNLDVLWLDVNLAKTDFGLDLFECLPSFIEKHKAFEDLIIQFTVSNKKIIHEFEKEINDVLEKKPEDEIYNCKLQGENILEIIKNQDQ